MKTEAAKKILNSGLDRTAHLINEQKKFMQMSKGSMNYLKTGPYLMNPVCYSKN